MDDIDPKNNHESTITFYGVNTDQVRYGDNGMTYQPSLKKDKFTLRISKGCLDYTCFLVDKDTNGHAVLATAHRYISLPYGDFLNLLTYYLESHKDIKYLNNLIQGSKPCSQLNLLPVWLWIGP